MERITSCTSLSDHVGMPSGLVPPFGLGMFLRLTGGQCSVVCTQAGIGPEIHVWVIELSVHIFQWKPSFASVLNNSEECFGGSHLAYLDILSIGNLLPFAVGLL